LVTLQKMQDKKQPTFSWAHFGALNKSTQELCLQISVWPTDDIMINMDHRMAL